MNDYKNRYDFNKENKDTFYDDVYKPLRGFSHIQNMYLTWLCTVRMIPFLSIKRGFGYWSETERQKHLLSIFTAIDAFYIRANDIDSSEGDNFYTASKAAYAFADAYASANSNVYSSVANVAKAARTCAIAHSYAYADERKETLNNAAYTSAYYAIFSCVSSFADKVSADNNSKEIIQKIILDDMKIIKTGEQPLFNNDVNVYGEIWQNFLTDLCEHDCEYWADIYCDYFKNGFVMDEEELQRRLGVPDKIRERGAAAVADYVVNLKKQGAESVAKETRLILIGSAGAGKTTLARRLNDDPSYPSPGDTTHGVDMNVTFNFNGVKTHLWDFGGQVIYHSSHRCFISENCTYILVVNGRDESARDIMKIEYWLDTIRVYSNNNAKVFILINESDNRKQDVSEDELMHGQYGNLIQDVDGFNIGSDFIMVEQYKNKIASFIEKRGHQLIGVKDKKAMDDLKALFDGDKKVVERSELWDILERHGITENNDKERAADLFNVLGIALSYDCIADYILDPSWISYGVYKVIDYMKNNNLNRIYESEFHKIFDNEPLYSKSKSEHIYELMIQHKIGFRDRSNKNGLLVPCVAPQSRPSHVGTKPDLENFVTEMIRHDHSEFPADFFERYIYANQEEIVRKDSLYSFWLTGMVLIEPSESANALVEIRQNRVIVITVWGKEKEKYQDWLYLRMDSLLKDYGFVAIAKDEEDIFGDKTRKMTVFHEDNNRIKPLLKKIASAMGTVVIAETAKKIVPLLIDGGIRLFNILFENLK